VVGDCQVTFPHPPAIAQITQLAEVLSSIH